MADPTTPPSAAPPPHARRATHPDAPHGRRIARAPGTVAVRGLLVASALACASLAATTVATPPPLPVTGGSTGGASDDDRTDPTAGSEAGSEAGSKATLPPVDDADLDPRLTRRFERWHELVDRDAYRFDVDRRRRLVFASQLPEESHRRMVAEATAIADAAAELLFGAYPEEPVLIVAATRRDARRLIGQGSNVGGKYVHVDRIVAVRDIGLSLRHEIIHALHYGHMERLGLRKAHPMWLQEGLATLFETAVVRDGRLVFEPNERMRIAGRLARRSGLDDLDELTAMDARTFMRRATRHYPQAFGITSYLAATGALTAWYQAFCEASDPTGLATLATLEGGEPAAFERAYVAWLRDRPEPITTVVRGGAWLGIAELLPADPDGVEVNRMTPRGPARQGGVRPGELVVAVDGRPTPTEVELDRLIARRAPGDVVELRVRRGTDYRTVSVTLGRYDG